MGWGNQRYHRVEEVPERCIAYQWGCRRTPKFWCRNMVGEDGTTDRGAFSCEYHKSGCCRPLKVGLYRSPLMELGTYVFGNKNSIQGAPEDLLLRAYAHVEVRLVRCRYGNARARATERWLGRWARIIDQELGRQREAQPVEPFVGSEGWRFMTTIR